MLQVLSWYDHFFPKGIAIMAIATVNPATGETLKTFQALTSAEIEQKLQLAVTAFRAERKTPSPSEPAACARPLTSSNATKINSPT